MMRKLTQKDWDTLLSFKGPVIDREEIFSALQLRANFEEMKELITNLQYEDEAANKFDAIFHNFPDSMSYEEREELYRLFLLEEWHHDHENMIVAFQQYFNKNPKNIQVILKRIYDIPKFYRHDKSLRNPFIRKCMYAIAAQPEPENIETLIMLSDSTDEVIRDYAEYQLEMIADNKSRY